MSTLVEITKEKYDIKMIRTVVKRIGEGSTTVLPDNNTTSGAGGIRRDEKPTVAAELEATSTGASTTVRSARTEIRKGAPGSRTQITCKYA